MGRDIGLNPRRARGGLKGCFGVGAIASGRLQH